MRPDGPLAGWVAELAMRAAELHGAHEAFHAILQQPAHCLSPEMDRYIVWVERGGER